MNANLLVDLDKILISEIPSETDDTSRLTLTAANGIIQMDISPEMDEARWLTEARFRLSDYLAKAICDHPSKSELEYGICGKHIAHLLDSEPQWSELLLPEENRDNVLQDMLFLVSNGTLEIPGFSTRVYHWMLRHDLCPSLFAWHGMPLSEVA